MAITRFHKTNHVSFVTSTILQVFLVMFVLFGMGQVLLDAHRLLDCGPREQVVNLFHTLLCVRAVLRTHLCVYGGRGGGECGGGGGTHGGGPPLTPARIEKTTAVPDLQSARFFLLVAQRELDRGM